MDYLDELPGPSHNQTTRPTYSPHPITNVTIHPNIYPSNSDESKILDEDAVSAYGPESEDDHDHDSRRQTSSCDVETATESPSLEEIAAQEPLDRTERLFLDRINACDEEELITACHRMNSEITTCTQSIADEWSRARPEKQVDVSSTSSVISGSIRNVIGSEILHRIHVAKSPQSHLDLESTLEFALRAWTIDCVTKFIFQSLLSPNSDLGYIEDDLAKLGSLMVSL